MGQATTKPIFANIYPRDTKFRHKIDNRVQEERINN